MDIVLHHSSLRPFNVAQRENPASVQRKSASAEGTPPYSAKPDLSIALNLDYQRKKRLFTAILCSISRQRPRFLPLMRIFSEDFTKKGPLHVDRCSSRFFPYLLYLL